MHGGWPPESIIRFEARWAKQGNFNKGMRITDEETMEVVEWVLGGEVQQDIVMRSITTADKRLSLTSKGWWFNPRHES